MTRTPVRDLCQKPSFVAALQGLSRADDFALVYDTERHCHWANFVKVIFGKPWLLRLPIESFELDWLSVLLLIEHGNRMIADVEAHYRQQAVAR